MVLELPSDQGPVRVHVRDLSAGGARIRVDNTVPVGAELDVRLGGLVPGDDEVLSLRARVLRIQRAEGETDLALEFVDRVESTSSRLQTLVETLRKGDPRSAAAQPVEVPVGAAALAGGASPTAGPPPTARNKQQAELRRELLRLEEELVEQVERGDRAEASLQVIRQELVEEQERRRAAERTLVTLQSELSRSRSERGELERLRQGLEDRLAGAASESEPEETEERPPGRPGSKGGEAESRAPSASRSRPGSQRAEAEGSGSESAGTKRTAAPAGAGGGEAKRSGRDRRVAERRGSERRGAAGGGAESGGMKTVLVGPQEVGSRVVFARYLRDGARLRPTERFARFEPVSRLDIRVHEYARRSDHLAGIRKLANRRVNEEEILRVLFTFFERGLLQLETSGPSGAAGSGLAS